ncbi:recombinase family protein [Pseudokineococcus lusitanus]|uniref:DNA invertase Pin-like site-specific DNA recombinase n=1 Tax=Pseudokineococcus lusitanus TaxID=763993 RepID=A0A3N1HSQ6_9ACTN|nr:recombinase family protein [Pseudokineococcus lusitanus]ROP45555.1 DNA invertase Pin-like site-specific DNA recombinase [Pseudokineococcus lusitanus]
MPHAHGYARVSTTSQDASLQHDALTAAGCARLWTDVASGSRDDRPQLAQLLERLLPGDTLVVWRLDRLGRSLPHLLATVNELEARGVGFRSLTESIDTTTAGGRLVFSIFGALADFERQLIRERTIAGLEAARARGRVGGRPTVMGPERIEAARALLAQPGATVTGVAAHLGVSRNTIYRNVLGSRATDEQGVGGGS